MGCERNQYINQPEFAEYEELLVPHISYMSVVKVFEEHILE